MGETRKSSWVPSKSSGWESSSTTVLEKPARWRGWENIASHNTPRGTILGIQISISFWCVYHEDLEISWLSVSVLNWKAQTNNHQSGYCLKYTGSAITRRMEATVQPWSGSSQVTSNESWWLQTSSRAVWHRALLCNTRTWQWSAFWMHFSQDQARKQQYSSLYNHMLFPSYKLD